MNNNININISELLKDCPRGTKLYSPIFGEVYLDKIRPHLAIVVTTDKEQGDFKEEFLYDGRYDMNGECMLYPSKGKTTWEGFVPPCKFKDGDILFVDCSDEEEDESYQYTFILNKPEFNGKWHSYCHLDRCGYFYSNETYLTDDEYHPRFATEEEKQKLFQAIKDNGYRWNSDTKTLEKLVEPKFKVGDRIERFGCRYTITEIRDNYYLTKSGDNIRIDNQDVFELPQNKFDITTLNPFDMVLVRYDNDDPWIAAHFSHYTKDAGWKLHYFALGSCFKQCIPYEHNEHLLGTTNDCDEYYKTWKDETDE